MAEETVKTAEITGISIEKTKPNRKKQDNKPNFTLEKIPDVKPCPKCQKKAMLFRFHYPDYNANDYFVGCSDKDCKTSNLLLRTPDVIKAIETWNNL